MVGQPSFECPDPPSLAIPVLGTTDMAPYVLHEPAMGVLAGTQGNLNRVTASEDEGQVPWVPEASLPSPQKHWRAPHVCAKSSSANKHDLRVSEQRENGSCTLHDTEPDPGGAGMSNALPWAKELCLTQGMI